MYIQLFSISWNTYFQRNGKIWEDTPYYLGVCTKIQSHQKHVLTVYYFNDYKAIKFGNDLDPNMKVMKDCSSVVPKLFYDFLYALYATEWYSQLSPPDRKTSLLSKHVPNDFAFWHPSSTGCLLIFCRKSRWKYLLKKL